MKSLAESFAAQTVGMTPDARAKRAAERMRELATELKVQANASSHPATQSLRQLEAAWCEEAADIIRILALEQFRQRESTLHYLHGVAERDDLRRVSRTWNEEPGATEDSISNQLNDFYNRNSKLRPMARAPRNIPFLAVLAPPTSAHKPTCHFARFRTDLTEDHPHYDDPIYPRWDVQDVVVLLADGQFLGWQPLPPGCGNVEFPAVGR